MKTLKSIALAAVIMLSAGAFAQTVVFEENFQTFKEEGFRNGSDTLPCPKKKVHSKANFKVTKMYVSPLSSIILGVNNNWKFNI